MKYKVKMTHTVELVIEGKTADQVIDWMYCHTPNEAKALAKNCVEFYDEEIVSKNPKDNADITLK